MRELVSTAYLRQLLLRDSTLSGLSLHLSRHSKRSKLPVPNRSHSHPAKSQHSPADLSLTHTQRPNPPPHSFREVFFPNFTYLQPTICTQQSSTGYANNLCALDFSTFSCPVFTGKIVVDAVCVPRTRLVRAPPRSEMRLYFSNTPPRQRGSARHACASTDTHNVSRCQKQENPC